MDRAGTEKAAGEDDAAEAFSAAHGNVYCSTEWPSRIARFYSAPRSGVGLRRAQGPGSAQARQDYFFFGAAFLGAAFFGAAFFGAAFFGAAFFGAAFFGAAFFGAAFFGAAFFGAAFFGAAFLAAAAQHLAIEVRSFTRGRPIAASVCDCI